ncbi:GTP-binding protein HflX [Halovivax ruber XH-70]|uniref:GTPase HflX n=1 Tax=Halovivax ruber (strain DSM 18193 / JCM 13892 / XH-70) TaxID=797302 RepID=L0IAC0_HALRX|nr:GTPase HflX [Halovivax ruber]AGB15768.1 GTP-binding protein HflX [Halovivax ruber XH-70]
MQRNADRQTASTSEEPTTGSQTDEAATSGSATGEETTNRDDSGSIAKKGTAIVAARGNQAPVETTEIRQLTEAAGYRVVDEFTQVRPRDPGTNLGDGKVAEIARRAEVTEAMALVVDGELTPTQTTTLAARMPDETRVFDRYRLILAIFAEQARHRRAQLQVELARLRYDLPRIKEAADEGLLNRRTERGTPYYDVRDRIDRLERKLEELPTPAEQFRERRRQEGFDLVTLAGYTNAGKSTLLHRLADDLSVTDASPAHPDETGVAEIEDRLFKTLETTTRRATLDERPTLVTDTVGFVQDLPHWLVQSFSETLSEAASADVVVLVADGADPVGEFEAKLDVSLSVLDEQDVARDDVVVTVNKIDCQSSADVERRRRIAAERADSVVTMSASEGTNFDRLVDAIAARLPSRRETITLPNGDEAMSLLSWLYDHVTVDSVEYTGKTVVITVDGRPSVIAKALARAEAIAATAEE